MFIRFHPRRIAGAEAERLIQINDEAAARRRRVALMTNATGSSPGRCARPGLGLSSQRRPEDQDGNTKQAHNQK